MYSRGQNGRVLVLKLVSMPFEIFIVFVRLWYFFRNMSYCSLFTFIQIAHVRVSMSLMSASEQCFSFPTLLRIWMNYGEGYSISLIGTTFLWQNTFVVSQPVKTVYDYYDCADSPPPPYSDRCCWHSEGAFCCHSTVEQNCQVYILAISCKLY